MPCEGGGLNPQRTRKACIKIEREIYTSWFVCGLLLVSYVVACIKNGVENLYKLVCGI